MNPLHGEIFRVVKSINRKNFKSNVAQINEIIELYGPEARLILISRLIAEVAAANGNDTDELLRTKVQLLSHEVVQASMNNNLPSVLFRVFQGVESLKITEGFIESFVKSLDLSLPQAITVALGLSLHEDVSVQYEGIKFLVRKIPEFASSVAGNLPDSILHTLLYLLQTDVRITDSNKLINDVLLAHPQAKKTSILDPLLFDFKESSILEELNSSNLSIPSLPEFSGTEVIMTCSLGQLVKELGPGVFSSKEILTKVILKYLSSISLDKIRACDVAQLIGVVLQFNELPHMAVDEYQTCFISTFLQMSEKIEVKVPIDCKSVLIATLSEFSSAFSWLDVIGALDHPEFMCPNGDSLRTILSIFYACTSEVFPFECFYRPWKNTAGQLSLLTAAVNSTMDKSGKAIFPFNNLGPRARVFSGLSSSLSAVQEPWTRISFVECLFRLAEVENYAAVRKLFEIPISECPDILVLTLAESNDTYPKLRHEFLSVLVPFYMNPSSCNYQVLGRIWSANKDVLLSTASRIYMTDNNFIHHIHNIGDAQSSDKTPYLPQWIAELLSLKDFSFVIDLAVVHCVKINEPTRLEDWLQSMLVKHNMDFATPFLDYIKKKILPKSEGSEKNFTPSICNIFLKCLDAILSAPSLKSIESRAKNLREESLRSRPDLFSSEERELENESSTYLAALYGGKITIDSFMDFLLAKKESKDPKENKIFEKSMQLIIEECKFYQNYPDTEITIAGQLLGKIVLKFSSSFMVAAILNFILEYLKKKPTGTSLSSQPIGSNGRLYFLAVTAIEIFSSRLADFPAMCANYMNIAHFALLSPDLAKIVQSIIKAPIQTIVPVMDEVKPETEVLGKKAWEKKASSPKKTSPTKATQPPILNEIDVISAPVVEKAKLIDGITTLNENEFVVPSLELQDLILVKLNNVTDNTLVAVSESLSKHVSNIHYPWLSMYLVEKRLCSQPNYHDVYLSMLEHMANKRLNKQVVRTSIFFAVKMLSDKKRIVKEVSERNSLKNLGLWIGKFTLSRNKPILHTELDIKEVLYKSYENGSMIAIIPFISNILKGCKESDVFQPPQPWTMGMLSVFREFYSAKVEGCCMKMNLLFEIEILFKHLSIKMEDVPESNYLSERKPPNLKDNPDFAYKDTKESTAAKSATAPTIVSSAPPSSTEKVTVAPKTETTTTTTPSPASSNVTNVITGTNTVTVIPNLAKYVKINSSGAIFQKKPALLMESVTLAVDRAIREIIQPVVLKSVTVAICTTKEIILKDFAFESDEAKMRASAKLMVSNLAGNLALVTCKDLLKAAISSKIIQSLQPEFGEKNPDVEEAANSNASENVELGVLLIEKAATEKAVRDIDEELNQQYVLRAQARGVGKAYFDQAAFNSGKYHKLPDFLRPRADGKQREQAKFYEFFALKAQNHSASSSTTASTSSAPSTTTAPSSQPPPTSKVDVVESGAVLSAVACIERLNLILTKLTNSANVLSSRVDVNKEGFSFQSSLPADHELKLLVNEIRFTLSKTVVEGREDNCFKYANKMFKSLFEVSTDTVKLQIYLAAIAALKEGHSRLSAQLTNLLIFEPDKRKLNLNVIVGMIKFKLLVTTEFDVYISQLLAAGYDEMNFEFAILLIQKVLLAESLEEPVAFTNTLTLLTKAPAGTTHQKAIQYILQMLNSKAAKAREASISESTPPLVVDPNLNSKIIAIKNKSEKVFVERIVYLLDTWIGILKEMESGVSAEKAYGAYLGLLQQQGVLKGDDNIDQFFKVLTEISIQRTLSSNVNLADGATFDYSTIEAYAQLVILLMKYADSVNPAARINLFNKVLGIINKTLTDDHDLKVIGNVSWDQRPHFRLIYVLMMELITSEFSEANIQILNGFANSLFAIAPSRTPGFAFSWLELFSHRKFMPKLLKLPKQSGFPLIHRFLLLLLTFMEPFLRQYNLTKSIKQLYQGSMRVFLILLHDFPEFLSDHYFSLCNAIPSSCVQLRNLILSAFPTNMKLPDPFDSDLRIDTMPEMNQVPRISANIVSALTNRNFKGVLDNYLTTRQPQSFLREIQNYTALENVNEMNMAGTQFNIVVINSLVLYLGQQHVINDAPLDIFRVMLSDFSTEGRYLVLNAIVNQLRYPNSHTHYFSRVLLHLFGESTDESLQEQITRVLLERLVAFRPHPWGLLITFIELIKNTKYKFWSHSFYKCSPDIEKLFGSVALSCKISPPV